MHSGWQMHSHLQLEHVGRRRKTQAFYQSQRKLMWRCEMYPLLMPGLSERCEERSAGEPWRSLLRGSNRHAWIFKTSILKVF